MRAPAGGFGRVGYAEALCQGQVPARQRDSSGSRCGAPRVQPFPAAGAAPCCPPAPRLPRRLRQERRSRSRGGRSCGQRDAAGRSPGTQHLCSALNRTRSEDNCLLQLLLEERLWWQQGYRRGAASSVLFSSERSRSARGFVHRLACAGGCERESGALRWRWTLSAGMAGAAAKSQVIRNEGR